MTDPILKAIATERQHLKQRLATLAEMERRVRNGGSPVGLTGSRPHAPAGALRAAILESLRGAGAMYSKDLKAKVKAEGYNFPVNGQYFTRTLRELSDEKEIVKIPNGSFSTYQLKRR